MPEFRRDPVTGNQVIIAPDRAARPGAKFDSESSSTSRNTRPTAEPRSPLDADCPFCPGNESQTPEPVLVSLVDDSTENKEKWSTRVVPNLYPALTLESNESSVASTPSHGSGDFYQSTLASGHHEVVIESRRHIESFSQLDDSEAALTFRAYRERFLDWKNDSGQKKAAVVYPIAFKNCRPAAGASRFHVHSQLMGMPFVPNGFQRELHGAQQYFAEQNRCVFCEMIEREIADGRRLIYQDDLFIAVCPFASRAPYEIWILPRKHGAFFENESIETVSAAGLIVRDCARRLEQAIAEVPYNYVVHTVPFDTTDQHYYHWHIEITPRIARLAGFEWGTGCIINTVAPEQAAADLRVQHGG